MACPVKRKSLVLCSRVVQESVQSAANTAAQKARNGIARISTALQSRQDRSLMTSMLAYWLKVDKQRYASGLAEEAPARHPICRARAAQSMAHRPYLVILQQTILLCLASEAARSAGVRLCQTSITAVRRSSNSSRRHSCRSQKPILPIALPCRHGAGGGPPLNQTACQSRLISLARRPKKWNGSIGWMNIGA